MIESSEANTQEDKNQEAGVVEPEKAMPPVALAELPEPLRQAVARAGWSKLMPVQSRAIPYLLAGRDLMVQSRTGSGKTGAFLLPILDRIDARLMRSSSNRSRRRLPSSSATSE